MKKVIINEVKYYPVFEVLEAPEVGTVVSMKKVYKMDDLEYDYIITAIENWKKAQFLIACILDEGNSE